MSLDARYDSRSMSSVHSYHSLQSARLVSKKSPIIQAEGGADATSPGDQTETQFWGPWTSP